MPVLIRDSRIYGEVAEWYEHGGLARHILFGGSASGGKTGSLFLFRFGEVAEWSNAAVSKTVIPAMVSGVRIPPSPPKGSSPSTEKVHQKSRQKIFHDICP